MLKPYKGYSSFVNSHYYYHNQAMLANGGIPLWEFMRRDP